MKKRILSFFLAVTIMFTVFVPVSALVSAEETTETKTEFTVKELLELGFVSSIDYSSIHLKSLYNISQSTTATNFDTALFLYNSNNVKYHATDSALDVDSESSLTAPLFVLFEYYTYSDSEYNYYSNFSREYSIYPFYQKRMNTIISASTDFSSYHTMKNVIGSDKIIFVREKKSDKSVDCLICNYSHYEKYHVNSSLSDIFKSCCIINTPVYYRVSFSNNSTDNNVSTEKNYQLWGVVLRSKEEIQAIKQSFIEWFISNNKIDYLISNGIDVSVEHVSYLFDWWNAYGDNIVTITLNLPKLISNINIINWDINLAKRLVDCFENLYIQYQEYVAKLAYGETRPVQGSTNYMPHHRRDDTDDTLVTDTEEDTTVVILLREIVRLLIDLPESIRLSFVSFENRLNAIITNMNNIIMYLDSLPDYIATSAYNVFIDPINQIIDALGNVGSSTNIEIEIPETKKDEVDLFFDEWHTNFSDAINNKVPVYSQLSSLFNDNFFEKCGLDVNGDGETFAYYTAPGSVGSGDVQTLALNTSALSDSGEHVAVRSLLEQFDHADTSYLDDASYSGDIPEGWTVTVGGQDIEIFDFRFYAKHRTKIHVIITFILYSTYLLSLLKSIPTLIGNVSDVRNAFDTHSQKEE